jgi:outer membrane protein TolC
MAYAFDSLGYAKRLRDGGVPQEQAEVHAEAARDFIMTDLATKADVLAVKADVLAVKADLVATEQRLQKSIEALRTSTEAKFETMALRLTVRLGAMLVVAIGALATILKLP